MVEVPQTLHAAKPPVSRKGSPDDVPALATLHREPNTKKVPIQVKVSADLAREFRIFCVSRDLDMSTAFVQMFEEYRQRHGG